MPSFLGIAFNGVGFMPKAARNVLRSRWSVSSALYGLGRENSLANHSTRRAKRKRRVVERYTSEAFLPYVKAIGQLALTWNDLHETLGSLFCTIADDITEMKLHAVWHSANTDRAKRAMLEAVVRDLSWQEKKNNPRAEKDLDWLLRELNKLEDIRNNAIHAPLKSFDDPVWRVFEKRPEGIAPNDLHGNRRALQMMNKDLLKEYRYCRNASLILREFADAIQYAWGYTEIDPSWPERPQLPNRGQKNGRPNPRRPRGQGQLPLLPES
ncbi:MAG TPA: hypothetical protein VHU87_15785 [Rhizomicrobium sp.]|nr:hypothetical protein [Rhizomicrobium sp.]